MEAQLAELLETIKRDGVQKAESLAGAIIKEAEGRAADIIADAERRAARIVKEGEGAVRRMERSSHKLLKHAVRDLQLIARDRLMVLFKHYLTLQHREALSPDRFAEIVVQAVSHALAHKQVDVSIEIASQDYDAVLNGVRTRITRDALAGTVDIVSSTALKNGLRISSNNGALTYDLSIEAIADAVYQLLHPALKEILQQDE